MKRSNDALGTALSQSVVNESQSLEKDDHRLKAMQVRAAAIASWLQHIQPMHAEHCFSKVAHTILEYTQRHWCPFIAYAILGPSGFSDLFQPLKTSYTLPSGKKNIPSQIDQRNKTCL